MQNWQDLLNYVNNVLITYDPSYLNKARYGNDLLLSLANEAFNRLKALDYVCFVNDYAVTSNTKIVKVPNACDKVCQVILKGEVIKSSNPNDYLNISDLAYYLTDTQIVFNQSVTFAEGELQIIGKGTFSKLIKNPNSDSPFNALNERHHELIAWYMLANYAGDVNDRNVVTRMSFYTNKFNEGLQEYKWSNVVRRCEPFKLFDSPTRPYISGNPYLMINNVSVTYLFNSDDYYTKPETDLRDTDTLDDAETFAETGDTETLDYSRGYTDYVIGNINELLDDINGETI